MTTTSLYGFETRDIDHRRTDRSGTWDIKQLWQRSHEILGMALGGMSQVDIAKQLGITPATVSNTVNSSLGKEKLSEMRKTRDERFEEINEEVLNLTEKALKVYNKIFAEDGDSPASLKLQKETADTVALDLAGIGIRNSAKMAGDLGNEITIRETREFIIRGQEAAKQSGFLTTVLGEGHSRKSEEEAIDV